MQSFRNYLIWTTSNTVAVETLKTGWKEIEPEPVQELNLKQEISLDDLLGSAQDKKMSSESSEKDKSDSGDECIPIGNEKVGRIHTGQDLGKRRTRHPTMLSDVMMNLQNKQTKSTFST